MPRALRVNLNRSGHNEVDARTKRFAADGPFVLELRNHGEGSHVHVAASGDLAIDADLPDDNPFVPAGETLELPVAVTSDLRPATGTVTVTAGYGRNEVSVDVRVNGESPGDDAEAVEVGAEEDEETSDGAGGPVALPAALGGAVTTLRRAGEQWELPTVPSPSDVEASTLVVLALAVVAVLAAAAMYSLFESFLVLVATVVVLVTVLGAFAYLLLR